MKSHTGLTVIISAAFLLGLTACTTKTMPEEEGKKYPDALFTLGKISMVELEMPEETWQKIIKKASDKKYYECNVTINGEQLEYEVKGLLALHRIPTSGSSSFILLADSTTAGPNDVIKIELNSKSEMDVQKLK